MSARSGLSSASARGFNRSLRANLVEIAVCLLKFCALDGQGGLRSEQAKH